MDHLQGINICEHSGCEQETASTSTSSPAEFSGIRENEAVADIGEIRLKGKLIEHDNHAVKTEMVNELHAMGLKNSVIGRVLHMGEPVVDDIVRVYRTKAHGG
ncbi:MAG: hypothetical protein JW884_11740 [Deltaproteobacteria bacterium]|nr:hypothetical protein [Deltaproteobacteria bacterium]